MNFIVGIEGEYPDRDKDEVKKRKRDGREKGKEKEKEIVLDLMSEQQAPNGDAESINIINDDDNNNNNNSYHKNYTNRVAITEISITSKVPTKVHDGKRAGNQSSQRNTKRKEKAATATARTHHTPSRHRGGSRMTITEEKENPLQEEGKQEYKDVAAFPMTVMDHGSGVNLNNDNGNDNDNDSDNHDQSRKALSLENGKGGRERKSRSTTPKPSRTPRDPWPEIFKRLSQTHRALNLVYTFCCTRKHLATTFETIKAAVQAQMSGRELSVDDVARIKVLVPRAIRFEYVDKASLEVMGASEGGKDDYSWMKPQRQTVEGKSDALHHHNAEGLHNGDDDDDRREDNDEWAEVLLFEFVDGDLKRQVQHRKTGEPTKPTKRLRNDELKLPVFSQKQMVNLIDKRNKKFAEAVNVYLVGCEDDGANPIEQLETDMAQFIPAPSRSGLNTPTPRRPPPQIPKERKSISDIIADIREMEWYTAQIVPDGHRVFDPQPAVYGELNFPLSQNLVNALYNTRDITRLYSHQAEAINSVYGGHNVIVSTSTSSGKSLIYQIPMLHELEKDPNSRGIYIFPTKALAQDQRRSMKELLRYMHGLENTIVETFDGDTPMVDRNTIRDEGRIIFTNPDMLHITILPQEGSWRTFLQNLKFVVVDELHVYNGLFGSHVAFVMRRLRRICAAVGNRHIKFISCSATVANPEEHMKDIFGLDNVKLIDFDGSPSGRKEFICWNTPFKDPNDPTSGRGDSISETAKLFCQLLLRGVRVIAFCRIRKQCEIVLQAVRNEFQAMGRPEVGKLVMGYRGGYNPQDRRRIEKEMFDGKLMGIVATNALELGVDIGSLDGVITLGFPFSISNLRQQSGRAGRRNKDSLSVLIGDSFPTDQHYMKNPGEIFTRPNCELQVDLTNELVLEGHIQCAAFEAPLKPEEDSAYFGPKLAEFASTRLVKDHFGFYHCHERFRPQPARHVSIRDVENAAFAVIDTTHNKNTVLEEVEESRAFFTIYEGGIFMHQGQTYMVKELNTEQKYARVVRVHVDWNTQQRDYTDIDPIETEAIRRIHGISASRAYYGTIQIHAVVYGFFKIDKKGRVLDAVQVDNPPIDRFSKGMWLDVPKKAMDILESRYLNIAAAIHAAEHAVLSLLPTFVISQPGDVRTECKVAKKELGKNLKRANEHNSLPNLHHSKQPYRPGPTLEKGRLEIAPSTNGEGLSSLQDNHHTCDLSTLKHPASSSDSNAITRSNSRANANTIAAAEESNSDLRPPYRQRPARLTFYDAKGGASGSGIAGKAFEFVDLLLRQAVERIESCSCVNPQGCVECCCDERCKEANVVMSKAGASVVLRCLLGWEIDIDSLPWGEDFQGEEGGGELLGGYETVIMAPAVPGRAGGTVRVFTGDGKMEEVLSHAIGAGAF